WEPPRAADAEAVAAALSGYGARPWQVELVTPVLVEALAARAA
ncbi:ribonuclease D, partial [Streptomyces sp. NPDC096080]